MNFGRPEAEPTQRLLGCSSLSGETSETEARPSSRSPQSHTCGRRLRCCRCAEFRKRGTEREASTRGGALRLAPEAESSLCASTVLRRLCEESCKLRRLWVPRSLRLGLAGPEREAAPRRSAGLQPEACGGCSGGFRGSEGEASRPRLTEVKRHSAVVLLVFLKLMNIIKTALVYLQLADSSSH